jgi:hypothetical protein
MERKKKKKETFISMELKGSQVAVSFDLCTRWIFSNVKLAPRKTNIWIFLSQPLDDL